MQMLIADGGPLAQAAEARAAASDEVQDLKQQESKSKDALIASCGMWIRSRSQLMHVKRSLCHCINVG